MTFKAYKQKSTFVHDIGDKYYKTKFKFPNLDKNIAIDGYDNIVFICYFISVFNVA